MPDVVDDAVAQRVASQALAARWPQLGRLAELTDPRAGEPVLVHTVFGEPSYWTVPVLDSGRLAGFIRVLGDGRITAAGAFGGDSPDQLITGIPAEEAVRLARERIRPESHETIRDPLFVHDGPPGREVWLVPVETGRQVTRWLFVTRGRVYERAAGELRDDSLE